MDAGMIILGKAGMSEYCGSHDLPAGYSASNGQVQSPYIYGGRREDDGIAGTTSPGGSSAGSGAGVAAAGSRAPAVHSVNVALSTDGAAKATITVGILAIRYRERATIHTTHPVDHIRTCADAHSI